MKTFLSFFALLLIVSCSSSTGPEEEKTYPYHSGNWLVEAPNLATWTGSSNKQRSKQDTAVVSQAGDLGLRLWTHGNVEHAFEMEFSDTDIPRDSVLGAFSTVSFSDTVFGDEHIGKRPSSANGELTIDIDFRYDCPEPFDDSKIWLTTYADSGHTVYRVIEIHAGGMEEAVREVTDCPITP